MKFPSVHCPLTPHSKFLSLFCPFGGVVVHAGDSQKLAKLAIYDVHRGNTESATKKLDDAMAKTKLLWPIIDEHPALRPGR